MALVGLLTEYRAELVADFWRYYHSGPDQLLDSGVPILDVADMAAHLPRESAVMQALVPHQEVEDWKVTDYLLASVIDLLAAANYQRAGGRGQKPKPLPRPKYDDPNRRKVTADDLAAFRDWYSEQPGGRTSDE